MVEGVDIIGKRTLFERGKLEFIPGKIPELNQYPNDVVLINSSAINLPPGIVVVLVVARWGLGKQHSGFGLIKLR